MRRVLLVLALATSAARAEPSIDVTPAGSVLSSAGGRYVFGQISGYGRHQFMLDTQTGRLWRMVCAKLGEKQPGDVVTPCDLHALDPQPYLNSQGDQVGFTPPAAK